LARFIRNFSSILFLPKKISSKKLHFLLKITVDEIGVKLNLRGQKTAQDFWIDPSLYASPDQDLSNK
jgi:hypothetical protein